MRSFATMLVICLGLIGSAYLLLCAFLYLQQDAFLFYPRPNDASLRTRLRESRVVIPAGDVSIEGWWAERASAGRVILYFGGNAEDVLYFAASADFRGVRRILVANYRGYGGTPGKLSEAAAYSDALAIYDYAAAQPGIDRGDIFVMGRSLGSGIATWLAAHRPVAGCILVTPYDDMRAVAQHHYPMFPVRWLLRHRFPSVALAPTLSTPVLMLAAEDDVVVPPEHARRLYGAWAGPKQFELLPGVGHNDIELDPRYGELVEAFISRHGDRG